MQKDFKIGLAVGLVVASAAIIWLCTLPKLSTKARALQSAANKNPQAAPVFPNPPTPSARPVAVDTPTTIQKNDQPSARFYIVQKGDTLSAISAKYYGSPNQWPRIVAANKSTLTDPDKLTPGSRLVIPE